MSAQLVDDGLVTRAQEGDREAQSRLAEQVRPLVQRYALRFLRDPARAEDLAQTALMKAFSHVGDVRSPEAFRAWLLRITRNECLNELARHRHPTIALATLEEQGQDIEAPAGGDHDPEEALVRAQLGSLVRTVVDGLPDHYRRTLTMRALEDRTYEEISEALGVPVAVARLWYCRARKRFRQSFVAVVVARRDVPASCLAMADGIAELIEGALEAAPRARVLDHLAGCHVCRQTEDELRATAFRAPARAWVLGLGLAQLPARSVHGAGHAVGALRSAGGVIRMAKVAAATSAAAVAVAVPAVSLLQSPGSTPVVAPAAVGPAGLHAGDASALRRPDGVWTALGVAAATPAPAAHQRTAAGSLDQVGHLASTVDLAGIVSVAGTHAGGAATTVHHVGEQTLATIAILVDPARDHRAAPPPAVAGGTTLAAPPAVALPSLGLGVRPGH